MWLCIIHSTQAWGFVRYEGMKIFDMDNEGSGGITDLWKDDSENFKIY